MKTKKYKCFQLFSLFSSHGKIQCLCTESRNQGGLSMIKVVRGKEPRGQINL